MADRFDEHAEKIREMIINGNWSKVVIAAYLRAEFWKEETKSVRNEKGSKITVNEYTDGQIKVIFEGTGVTVNIDQNGAKEIINLLSGAVDNFPKESKQNE